MNQQEILDIIIANPWIKQRKVIGESEGYKLLQLYKKGCIERRMTKHGYEVRATGEPL